MNSRDERVLAKSHIISEIIMSNTDIYTHVTNNIIASIEAGHTREKFTLPWQGASTLPINHTTNKQYRGVNIPMLWASQMEQGFSTSSWASYKQWEERGCQVRKGQKGTPIVYWGTIEIEPTDDNEEASKRMFARYSHVFNADQVEGYEPPAPIVASSPLERISNADAFLESTGADIRYGGNRALYQRDEDFIALPDPQAFIDTPTSTAQANFYATALHELTHWTGASHRLDRIKAKRFDDKDCAFEELVAELGAAMLCASLGIVNDPRPDHAQYIDNWLHALKSDKKYIFQAASQAQKAADYLHGLQATDGEDDRVRGVLILDEMIG
jgi:antirestriction protein ArdC